jgi:LacI family transcriptional regulator
MGVKEHKLKPVTVVDIAKHSGVSKSTVSLVLQSSPLVKASTRQKVIRSARELGYVYNRAAASLRKTGSGTIGLVVTSISNQFFAEAASGVEAFFTREGVQGKTVLLGQHFEDPKRLVSIVRSMMESRVDGLIVVPALEMDSASEFDELVRQVPTVFLSRRPSSAGVYVGTDNFMAGSSAGAQLLGHGYKEILLMGGNAGSSAFEERLDGLKSAVTLDGSDDATIRTVQFPPTRDNGFDAMQETIASSEGPFAILAYNDLVASGVLAAATLAGLSAGVDYALVGIDNIEEARFTTPPLTTVDTRPNLIGTAAARALSQLLNGSDGPPHSVILPNDLCVRQTCGCIGGAP